MIIETKRLCLRPWRESDAKQLYKLAKDPEIGPPAGWLPHTSIENSREILKNVLTAEGTFAVTLKGKDTPIGCAGWMETTAHEDLHELELGYWMGQAYWGNGYAPEAVQALLRYCFETLGQSRIWCAHYAENDKSRRVIEKCGFQLMFRRKEKVEALGEERICCFYTLEAGDWQKPPFGTLYHARIDRPLGSTHPKHADIVYEVNYGYIPGIFAPDEEEQDVYILGVDEPVEEFTGKLIAVIHRLNDVEDKWVLAPENKSFTPEEIRKKVHFQERFFQTELLTEKGRVK